jgi:phosphate:Na+ symporter
MSGILVLASLAGYVALLLWGMHMVHSGVVRAYGAHLRQALSVGLKSRWKAFLAGLGVTTLLQSSTATGLMACSFVAGGLMSLVPALAVTLGANVGTTIIVQVLSFNVVAAAPFLLIAGLVAFKGGRSSRVRDLGRVGIGLGLILLALHLIIQSIEPMEQAQAVRDVFAALTGDPLLNIAMGALLTWAAYSSVAVVLLVMSLAAATIVTPAAAVALVLGANLGNVIPQYLAAGANHAARRLALGNLIVRGVGCLAVLPFLRDVTEALGWLHASPARQAADFHLAFNLVLALVFLGLLDPLAKLCAWMLPAKALAETAVRPRYLEDNPDNAGVALANAARETLRMVDALETMLVASQDALSGGDRKLKAEIGQLDNTLDTLHRAIKLHVTGLGHDQLDAGEAQRAADILAFSLNLEHAGDIIDKSLRGLAAKKMKHQLAFSAEGMTEIAAMYQRLLDSLHLAASVFVSGDVTAARALMEQKEEMRALERDAMANHFQRLRDARPESVETSGLHLDIVRDLKRIAAHIAAVAYPILEREGALRPSRLMRPAGSRPVES